MESGVAMAVAILRDAYPRADFPDRTAILYGAMLADLDDLLVVEAVRRLVRTSKFLPAISEIRETVVEAQMQLPTPEDAWDSVYAGQQPVHPLVRQSLDACGGRFAIRSTDAPTVMRAQFTKDYTARRGREIDSAMAGSIIRSIELPTTTRLTERPVFARLQRRLRGEAYGPATAEEKADAIRVLEAGPETDDPRDDDLYVEAERILEEEGR